MLGLFSGPGGRFRLYRPGMAPLAAPSVPIVYQLLKSVDHSTMALSQVVGPYLENPADQSWRGPMLAYRARMQSALAGLDGTSMPPEWRDNDRIILQNNIAFMDDCLANGAISFAALEAFAKKQAPYLKEDIAWAAQTQVAHWMKVLADWKKMLGGDWDKTYAASNAIYATRQNNVLSRGIDRIAGRVGLIPITAEHLLPIRQHLHPMGDLGLRRPGDVLLQVRRLFLGERLQRGEGDGTIGQTIVHECNVVLQNNAIAVPPLRS